MSAAPNPAKHPDCAPSFAPRPGSNLQTAFDRLHSKLSEIVPYQEIRAIALHANAQWDPVGTVFQIKHRLRLKVSVFRGSGYLLLARPSGNPDFGIEHRQLPLTRKDS